MRGLSLDLSRKSTGLALWDDGDVLKVWNIHLPEGFLGQQVRAWDTEVVELMRLRLDWLAYEDARAVSKQHGMIQFSMVGVLLMHCWDIGLQAVGVNQQTIKKIMTGNGHAKKPDMIAAAQARWPELGVEDDNQADALAVGLAFYDLIER